MKYFKELRTNVNVHVINKKELECLKGGDGYEDPPNDPPPPPPPPGG